MGNPKEPDTMDIWHVEAKKWTTLLLWRIDQNSFRVAQAGSYTDLLTNPNYTLLHKKYAFLFRDLSIPGMYQEVRIVDYLLQTENNNYIEIKAESFIDPASIHITESKGHKVWTYNGHLFISGELKDAISKLSKGELLFHLGFSMFGGYS